MLNSSCEIMKRQVFLPAINAMQTLFEMGKILSLKILSLDRGDGKEPSKGAEGE